MRRGRSSQRIAEVAYHRTVELAEVGVFETRLRCGCTLRISMPAFHDVRAKLPENEPLHDPVSYLRRRRWGVSYWLQAPMA